MIYKLYNIVTVNNNDLFLRNNTLMKIKLCIFIINHFN